MARNLHSIKHIINKIILIMKKSLFFTAMLAVAAVFVSCGNEPKEKDVKISLSPTELTLSEGGDEAKLTVTKTPADANIDPYVWESSDTLVAVVNDRGLVTSRYAGECVITVTSGNLKAECKVTVKSFLETLQFTLGTLWDVDTTYAQGKVDTIEASDGSSYRVYKALAEIWLFSAGFYINNSGYLDGAENAALIQFTAPMYYSTAYLSGSDRGTVFSLGDWIVTDVDTLQGRSHVGEPGKLDETTYLTGLRAFFDGYFGEDVETQKEGYNTALTAFSGAVIQELYYDVDESGEGGYYNSLFPSAIVTSSMLSFPGGNATYNYMYDMEYCAAHAEVLDPSWFGADLLIEEKDGEEYYAGIGDKILWANPIDYAYGEIPTNASKFKPLNMPVMTIDYPEVAERVNSQLKGTQVLRRK